MAYGNEIDLLCSYLGTIQILISWNSCSQLKQTTTQSTNSKNASCKQSHRLSHPWFKKCEQPQKGIRHKIVAVLP